MFNDALLDSFALLSICWLEHTMSKDAPGEDEEEDGVSEAASLEEPKEEDQGKKKIRREELWIQVKTLL